MRSLNYGGSAPAAQSPDISVKRHHSFHKRHIYTFVQRSVRDRGDQEFDARLHAQSACPLVSVDDHDRNSSSRGGSRWSRSVDWDQLIRNAYALAYGRLLLLSFRFGSQFALGR